MGRSPSSLAARSIEQTRLGDTEDSIGNLERLLLKEPLTVSAVDTQPIRVAVIYALWNGTMYQNCKEDDPPLWTIAANYFVEHAIWHRRRNRK